MDYEIPREIPLQFFNERNSTAIPQVSHDMPSGQHVSGGNALPSEAEIALSGPHVDARWRAAAEQVSPACVEHVAGSEIR